MTNLLRRCENCINGLNMPRTGRTNLISCEPVIPNWLSPYIPRPHQFVENTEAERCPAFRLRDIGENHNV